MPSESPTLSAIERLPLEVLLAISQHLPLIHLASASPTLYAHLAPFVHASVTLANHAQLDAPRHRGLQSVSGVHSTQWKS
ncbi:Transmembrane protein [Rhodotorula toruloides]|nr:Transmembrane protein [Rhodotorula toruloides]